MISSVGSSSILQKQLVASGLSADKAKLVDDEMVAAVQQTSAASSSTSDTGIPASATSVREALDARIDADVAAGKLTEDDAAKVRKTLDELDGQATGTDGTTEVTGEASEAAGATSGGGRAGGGGGGGSAEKTEAYQTVTVSGSTKTTTTVYTDGTSETETTTATDADQQKYAKPATAEAPDATGDYLATIEPGSLVDKIA